MFRRKVIVAVVCIVLFLALFIGKSLYYKDDVEHEEPPEESTKEIPCCYNEHGPVTFYELIRDYNRSILKFASYVPYDTVIVKDRIYRTEIQDDLSLIQNGVEYDYLMNIWVDSLKDIEEYNETPAMSMVSEYDQSEILSDFRVGDEITIYFSVNLCELRPGFSDSTRGDVVICTMPPGNEITEGYGSVNDDRTEVNKIRFTVEVPSDDIPAIDLCQEVEIWIFWVDNERTGSECGVNVLLHNDNGGYYREGLKLKYIENHSGVYIWKTIFDKMEETIPSGGDVFWHEIRCDAEEYTLVEGIITPGDSVNIILNFSSFSFQPTGGGLDPGSYVNIKFIPKHSIPAQKEFWLPDVFPEGEEWILLDPVDESNG